MKFQEVDKSLDILELVQGEEVTCELIEAFLTVSEAKGEKDAFVAHVVKLNDTEYYLGASDPDLDWTVVKYASRVRWLTHFGMVIPLRLIRCYCPRNCYVASLPRDEERIVP